MNDFPLAAERLSAMAGTPKDDLMALRDRYLRELVDMARDKDAALNKVRDILSLERAAATLQPEPAKYGGFKRAIDAMLDHLDAVGRPVEADTLVEAVITGGFRAPRKDGAAIVRKSISSYTKGEAGRKRQVIKQVNGKIGRGEWPDEWFGQEG